MMVDQTYLPEGIVFTSKKKLAFRHFQFSRLDVFDVVGVMVTEFSLASSWSLSYAF